MAFNRIVLFVIHVLYAMNYASNTYEKLNDSYWRSTSDFKPIPSSSYGNIQLLESLRMEFKLIFYDRSDYTSWQNIFRIGYISNNNGCYGYGSRYPSLWLAPDTDHNSNHLNLGISQPSNCHYGPWPNFAIKKHKIYTIIIQFNDTWVYMKINDHIHINEKRQEPTLNTIHNQYLNIWISTDTTNDIQLTQNINITLYDIIIHTWNTTTIQTINPSITPTINPSQHTYNPTIAPISFPIINSTNTTSEPDLMPGNIASTTTYLVAMQNITETDIIASLLMDSEETYLHQIKRNANLIIITKENLFFLVLGVLLTTFICLCIIIVVLCCYCCPKKQETKVKYHIPRNISRHKSNKMDKNSISLASYQSKIKQYDKHNKKIIHNNNNNINDDNVNVNINQCNIGINEGVLDNDEMIHMEGYENNDMFLGNNKTISDKEKFNNILNDANAINDIMLDDVIHEIETDGNINHQ
eukprot:82324_1